MSGEIGRHVITRVGTTPLSFKRMTCFHPLIGSNSIVEKLELVNGPELGEKALERFRSAIGDRMQIGHRELKTNNKRYDQRVH